MKLIVSEKYRDKRKALLEFIHSFQKKGDAITQGERNEIKVFNLNGEKINIKSFKVPNFVNKIAYKFFRKSKAQRSYEYAQYLLKHSIGTPYPVAYAEKSNLFSFGKSFYISEHLEYDLTYRELVTNPSCLDHEKILRAFTSFTFKLHENQIEFLDHSPGNTLIQLNKGDFKFYLVDLNRMNFKELSFDDRMKNFSRLTPKKEMVKVMASEYAKLTDIPEAEVFGKMWFYTNQFQHRFLKKQRLKKKIKAVKKFPVL